MPISVKRELIFLHIPKNAGTAITDSPNMEFQLIGHHLPTFYMSNFNKEWNSFLKFAVVRNPFDRAVSNYEYGRMAESYWHSKTGKAQYGEHPDFENLSKMSFKETIKTLHDNKDLLKHQGWGLQSDYVYVNDNMVLDKIFKLEDINTNNDFKLIIPNLQMKNKSDKEFNSYRDYYDDETKELVSEIYSKDIINFNYEF